MPCEFIGRGSSVGWESTSTDVEVGQPAVALHGSASVDGRRGEGAQTSVGENASYPSEPILSEKDADGGHALVEAACGAERASSPNACDIASSKPEMADSA